MAVNSGQIDLNADAVLFDRENEVMGFNSSGSNVSVGVSYSGTLSGDPVCDGEVLVHDQKVCHVGDDGGVNGSVVAGFHMNQECDVMISGSEKEGFGEENELVGRGNGLEEGVEVVDGGCDGKASDFSCGLVKNENKENVIQCWDGVPFVHGDVEPDKGLVFEFHDGVMNEPECENAMKVTENDLPSTKTVSSNEAPGVDNSLTECEQEAKNDAMVNSSVVVEDDSKMKAGDSLVTEDAAEITTYQLQDGIAYMEDMDVNAEADVIQNQTTDINIAEAGLSKNIQHECHGFNLVVDFNSYKNMQEDEMHRESVFSELNFCVSDLVWGKVWGHPWWPGQICDPSAASEKAKRHLKENCYLIAYFGDQTFAWNDESMIKPFHMHFSQMEKQSNLENFHHAVNCALDEVSRRVEFGLSCPCMPDEVFSKLKTQVISNAGICKQSCRRNGGDRFINATSFEPMKLVNFVKSLAQSPHKETDRLDFVIARAEILALYHSKGYSQLPKFRVFDGLSKEDDTEIQLMREKQQCDDQIDEQDLETHLGLSQMGKYRKQSGKKHKLLSDLMSDKSFCIPNGEHSSERKASDKSISRRPGRKRKAAHNTSDDYIHNAKTRKLTQLQYVSIYEMWFQLCLAAKDPAGESCISEMVYFFAEFRNSIAFDDSVSLHDGETGVTSVEAVAPMTTSMEPCNDSYWTDRIIQSISEDQSLSKNQDELPETVTEANYPSSKPQPAAEVSTNSGSMQQDTDRNIGSEPSKSVEHLDGCSSEEGISPTALTLKFTNLDSVPSTTDLNKIFGRFGPLIESKTELLKKTNRARVVFKRRADAETAFSSAGKYSIFGPSLVSYRLKILPQKKQTRNKFC